MALQVKNLYEFGRFRLDVLQKVLLRDGVPVSLTPKSFETLLLLVQNTGRVVEKEAFMRKVWSDSTVEEGNLTYHISLLRKVLSCGDEGGRYIETVPKRGYRFMADVRELTDGEVAQGVAQETRSTSHVTVGDRAPVDRGAAINSLAVLPLANASADPNAEYLSDGITESIINSLSRLRGLRVMARSTVFRYKGREVDAREVGRELRVGAVLLGRVLLFGDRLIIRMELVDVVEGWQLWGEQYSRDLSDIFEVQEEIASEISDRLRLKLTGEDKKRLTKRYTENTEAYQLYLKGRYHSGKFTSEGLGKGVEYFHRAIEKDPSYALAYAGLAETYGSLWFHGYVSPYEAEPVTRPVAIKALEIDDTLAEAHTSLALIKMFYDWDWSGSEREFKRAIELNPGYGPAHQWYGGHLVALGRRAEAFAEMRRAQELDPLSLMINAAVAWHFYFAREYEEAVEQLQKTLELDPNFHIAHEVLGLTYTQTGRYEEAITELKKAVELSGGALVMLAELRQVYAASGNRVAAREGLNELKERSKQSFVLPYHIAAIHTSLGEADEASEWLERAYRERYGGLVYINVDPRFDSLRADGRLADLVRRIGLTP